MRDKGPTALMAVLLAHGCPGVLATRWFLRRTTLRLWKWVAAFLLAVPVALWLAWLLGWL